MSREASRSPRVAGGRDKGLRVPLTSSERDWLAGRAERQGVSMTRLLRRGLARDAIADGDVPPETLCTASDFGEGFCPH